MKFNNTKTIAIDSNILTYFVEAISPGYTPDIHNTKEEVRMNEKERIATFQIPMYSKWYAILPAVRNEYLNIKNNPNKLLSHVYADETFVEYEERFLNRESINKRAIEFNALYHTGTTNFNDCLIAAEAEAISDTTILLSNDTKFIKRINPVVDSLTIIKPSEFKEEFNLINESLKISPHKTHHLFYKSWWKL